MQGRIGRRLADRHRCRAQDRPQIRPLPETVHDTLAWFKTLPAGRQAKLRAGLDAQKEADTLAQWHANKANG